MVNLTTASLEPAPLSSGWKSGSLPTGFTPTILREPGGAAATPPASKLMEKTREREGAGSRRPRPGQGSWRRRRLLHGLSVPSHARERGGRGGGDGRREGTGEVRESARYPEATARQRRRRSRPLMSFPHRPFWLHRPMPRLDPWSYPLLRNRTPAAAAQAQKSSDHTLLQSASPKLLYSSAVATSETLTKEFSGVGKARGTPFSPEFLATA